MKKLLSLIFILSGIILSAQTPPPPSHASGDSTAVTYSEVMPMFPDEKGFTAYLSKNVKYPVLEKENGIEGTVYISFVVEKDGSITNVHAVKEVPCGPGFTNEGIRIIQGMPPWKPGSIQGHPVRVEMKQPIRFVLDGGGVAAVDCGPDLTSNEEHSVCHCNPGTMPVFPGGDSALQNYFVKTLSLTKSQRNKMKKAEVPFSFVVYTDGRVVDVRVFTHSKNETLLKPVLASALCGMPRWTPGKGDFVNLMVEMKGTFLFGADGTFESVRFFDPIRIPYHFKPVDPKTPHAERDTTIQPHFPGGDTALQNYLEKNVHYPPSQLKNKKEIIIPVSFIIEADGSISYVEAKNENPADSEFSEEAVRVVKAMAKWEPGKIHGRPSRMPAQVNVIFKL
jgi:hypothetical protein